MIIKELILKLLDYNLNATVDVVVHNQPEDFSLTYSGPEGTSKEDCENVSFYVDDRSQNEIETFHKKLKE